MTWHGQGKANKLRLRLDHFGFLAPFYERFIQPRFPEKLITLLRMPASGSILDAGGGTGRVAQHLCAPNLRIWVADESLAMLCEAASKTGLRPVSSHIENAPFADSAFERILMVDALHHVANQAQTARELWRLLKPGGRIVIEEPDVRAFSVKLIAVAEKLALMRSHFLAPQQIASLFHFSGAQVHIEADESTAWVIVDKAAQPG